MGWITRQICNFFSEVCYGIIEVLNDFLSSMFFSSSASIANSLEVQTMVVSIQSVATVLISLMVAKQLFTVYILETDGDSDSDPLSFLVKAAVALALIWTCPAVTNMVLGYANELYSYLSDSTVVLATGEVIYSNIISSGANAVAATIFLLVYVIASVLLIIKAALRAVELGIMEILYSFFCIDILTTSQERWRTFFTSYMVVAFGYIIQLVCLQMCTLFCGDSLGGFFIALAFLFFAVKAPNWLEKFVYTSGAGRSAAGGIRSAMSMYQTMKMFKFYK